jgi:hypothetical protein
MLPTNNAVFSIFNFDPENPLQIEESNNNMFPFKIADDQIKEARKNLQEVKTIHKFILQNILSQGEDVVGILQSPEAPTPELELRVKRALLAPFMGEDFVLRTDLSNLREKILFQLLHGVEKHSAQNSPQGVGKTLSTLPALLSTGYNFLSMTWQQNPRMGADLNIDQTQERKAAALGLRSKVQRFMDIFALALGPKVAQVIATLKAESNDSAALAPVLHWLTQSLNFPRNGNTCFLSKAASSLMVQINMLSWSVWAARQNHDWLIEDGGMQHILIEDVDLKAMVKRLQLEACPGLGMSQECRALQHHPDTLDFYGRPGTGKARQQAWGRLGCPPLGDRSPYMSFSQMRQNNFVNTSREGLRQAQILLPLINSPITMVQGLKVNCDPTMHGIIQRFY